MTGTGKTYLARHLTAKIPRLVIIDTKGTLRDWNTIAWEQGHGKLKSSEPIRLRVQPPIDVKSINEYLDNVFLTCYRAGNLTVYIDEVYGVTPPGSSVMPSLFGLYTRGRELGIGVFSASQRPSWLPLVAISESEHFFEFRLQLADDRKRMAAFMGEEVLNTPNDPHGFYYYRAGDADSVYYSKLEEDSLKLKTISAQKQEKNQKTFWRQLWI